MSNNSHLETTKKIPTLESDIKSFVDTLPFWARVLSDKLLSETDITEEDINVAFIYLLEDIGLKEKTVRPEITIKYADDCFGTYKKNLSLVKLEKVEGVNALVENQTIEFNPKLTIIYGANGSGKSGYIRLLKKAFFSRAEETIIPNIHIENEHKETKAEFSFQSDCSNYTLNYPENSDNCEFKQFAVFDNKSSLVHLNNKNEFEYRPSGLKFFSSLIDTYKKIEEKIDKEIIKKNTFKDYNILFDGDSNIKTIISNISAKTRIEELKKFLPYTEADQKKKKDLEGRKVQLQTLKKDNEISELEEIKKLIETLKQNIETINACFTTAYLTRVRTTISDYINKEIISEKEGIVNFKSDIIKNIGSSEWKAFIEAAEIFAKLQGKKVYPGSDDFCLFCQQPLTLEARNLINNYWIFIKSQVAIEVKNTQISLDKEKNIYQELKFDLLPPDSILTKWLTKNYPKELEALKNDIKKQKLLSKSIIEDISTKTSILREENQIKHAFLDIVVSDINEMIKELKVKEPTTEIENVDKDIVYLSHKEKLSQHITDIEEYIITLKWIATITKARL